MDSISAPGVSRVVLMFASQLGKTEVLLNYIGYRMHLDPAAILMIQPTLEIAEAYSKDRLAPMLRLSPSLREILPDSRSRDSGQTLLHKEFPGGHITLAGANSPSGLASRPIEILLLDEIDRYDVSAGAEGDPIELAEARLTNFWNSRRVEVSSPGDRGASKIEKSWEESDQRRYYVPCPHCGEYQVLYFAEEWRPKGLPEERGYLKWDKDENDRPTLVRYLCVTCKGEIREADKLAMLAKGEWRAERPFNGVAGYWLNALYSPWFPWRKLVAQFYKVKGHPQKLKVFVNTRLAELWDEPGERVESSPLFARREDYPEEVPAGALALTCGIDVQDDRLEAEVVGWGLGDESWSIAYHFLYGDTSDLEVYERLDEDVLGRKYQSERGYTMRIGCACIDTGHRSSTVYAFTRTRAGRMIWSIKGDEGWNRPIVSQPHRRRSGRNRRPVKLWIVGVDPAKAMIYQRLRATRDQHGYCHFPTLPEYDEEHFLQLTAEKIVTRYTRGFAKRVWVKEHPRNEALDCRVYAYAALQIWSPPMSKLAKMAELQQPRSPADQDPGSPSSPPSAPKRKGPLRRPGRSWVDRWKG